MKIPGAEFVLGLNAYHGDSAACLIRDGRMVAAAEEERFRRVKHWAGFPTEAVKYCLAEAGIGLSDLSIVAINQDPSAHRWRKAAYALTRRPSLSLLLDRVRNRARRGEALKELARIFPGQRFAGQWRDVEHHAAHMASAFHVSPFKEACIASIDGMGDFSSACWGVGRGAVIETEGRVFFPHSLGLFYQAITQWLGFSNYGDEYKVMGLAPYGRPALLPDMRRIVRLQDDGSYRLDLRYFRHHRERVVLEWEGGPPVVEALYSDELVGLLGPARKPGEEVSQRHKDVARSAQAMYEEALFHLLIALHSRHGVDSIVLAGGCALNSVANGRVRRHTPFTSVYVQAAAGDAGGAIGAAFAAWHAARPGAGRRFVMDHAYWGPAFSDAEIEAVLSEQGPSLADTGCRIERLSDEERLCADAARCIADGNVVGWFQGRMEWGPRALGNRSILADPRRPDMKDLLNLKIKMRESFRPFAPSILREAVADWFESDEEVPFMMQVHQIRPEKRAMIPAVTHVDGSGRLQTVSREGNARYYRLLERFRELTGVPLVLNTSFNENEPVVCRPQEALSCFLRTQMDALYLGSWKVSR